MRHELICISASVEKSTIMIRSKNVILNRVLARFYGVSKRSPERKSVASNKELTKRIDELERTYDGQFKIVIDAIRRLMRPPVHKRKPIGFRAKIPKKRCKL